MERLVDAELIISHESAPLHLGFLLFAVKVHGLIQATHFRAVKTHRPAWRSTFVSRKSSAKDSQRSSGRRIITAWLGGALL
jgi:hypothetical protein